MQGFYIVEYLADIDSSDWKYRDGNDFCMKFFAEKASAEKFFKAHENIHAPPLLCYISADEIKSDEGCFLNRNKCAKFDELVDASGLTENEKALVNIILASTSEIALKSLYALFPKAMKRKL